MSIITALFVLGICLAIVGGLMLIFGPVIAEGESFDIAPIMVIGIIAGLVGAFLIGLTAQGATS